MTAVGTLRSYLSPCVSHEAEAKHLQSQEAEKDRGRHLHHCHAMRSSIITDTTAPVAWNISSAVVDKPRVDQLPAPPITRITRNVTTVAEIKAGLTYPAMIRQRNCQQQPTVRAGNVARVLAKGFHRGVCTPEHEIDLHTGWMIPNTLAVRTFWGTVPFQGAVDPSIPLRGLGIVIAPCPWARYS